MRYFLHVMHDSSALEDEEGTLLSGPGAAMSQAALVAAELAQDGRSYQGYVVRVIDEQGKEVGAVPIDVGA
jgi:hypothetical protein